jgi:hypothetical protein
MTMDLATTMSMIRQGKLSQFVPPIRISAAQLVSGVETRIRLPALISNLWLPPTYVLNGQLVANPATLVFGVRINTRDALMLPWGQQGNNVSAMTGAMEEIYVTLLSGVAADVVLHGARGIGISYSNGLTAAGTPSSSPSFGTTGTTQS